MERVNTGGAMTFQYDKLNVRRDIAAEDRIDKAYRRHHRKKAIKTLFGSVILAGTMIGIFWWLLSFY